jgi:isochorismate synthase
VPLSDGGVLLGASPELLLRKEGAHFSSLPLAGSARRQPDDVLDREAGTGCWRRKKIATNMSW